MPQATACRRPNVQAKQGGEHSKLRTQITLGEEVQAAAKAKEPWDSHVVSALSDLQARDPQIRGGHMYPLRHYILFLRFSPLFASSLQLRATAEVADAAAAVAFLVITFFMCIGTRAIMTRTAIAVVIAEIDRAVRRRNRNGRSLQPEY